MVFDCTDDYITLNVIMILDNQLKKMWMEMVLVSFKAVSQHYRKPQKTSVRTDGLQTKNPTQCVRNTQEH
jgi:hypothetical protein